MSMLSCPMCARLVSRRLFNPENLVEDVQVVSRRSLGRARGFEVTGRHSVLDDEELMDMISARCHIILRVIGEEVTEKAAATALEKELGDWRKEALGRREIENQLRDRIVGLQGSVDVYEENTDSLLAQVNGVLSEVYEKDFSARARA